MLPSMILLGMGAGIAFNAVLFAAMGDVEPNDAGLASGVVDTSFMMGGALGLAVLASVAASRTEKMEASGGALFAAGAAFVGGVFLRPKSMPMHEGEETVGVPAVAEADG